MLGDLEGCEEEEDEEDWTEAWGGTESRTTLMSPLFATGGNDDTKPHASSHLPVKLPTAERTGVEKDGLMSRMLLNDNKAGMEGLDKDRINQIILESSKGSKYFENEKKKEEQVNKRIEEQLSKLDRIGDVQLRQGLVEADQLLADLEGQRDLSRVIVHIDMDAFYAAVEMRENPSLKDKPMAVGGNAMLSTSNYLARKFGVRAAMPGFIAKKLCPELIIVKANFEKYTTVSKEIRSVMADYDPNFCPMSLDEAYLDMLDHLDKRSHSSDSDRTFLCRRGDGTDQSNGCQCDVNTAARDMMLSSKSDCTGPNSDTSNSTQTEQSGCDLGDTVTGQVCPVCGKPFPPYDVVTFGLSPDEAVKEMRSRIEQKTRLTASAGIAPNMMLAKVCSDKNKPNGQYRILPNRKDVMDFIRDLPTRKISGIGKVSERMLNAVRVHTCSDLYRQRALLYHLYSPISFNYFMRICVGIGSVNVERDSDRKSMSTERTFGEISKPEDLVGKCQELCESLCQDMKEQHLKGKTVAIKLKTVRYEVKTRAHTLRDYTSDLDVVFSAAQDLLHTEIQGVAPHPLRLRLMGVQMSSLLHEDLCRKKQNTLTRFMKQFGSADLKILLNPPPSTPTCSDSTGDRLETQRYGDSHRNLPTLLDGSETTSSDEKQCESTSSMDTNCSVSANFQESAEYESGKSSLKSSTSFKLASDPDFKTIDNGSSNPTELSELSEDVGSAVVAVGSEQCDGAKSLGDGLETPGRISEGSINTTGSLDSGSEAPVSCQLNNKEESGDFRQSANDALQWQPDVRKPDRRDEGEESQERRDNLEGKGDTADPYVCPVCQDSVKCDDLSKFNQHIDICLNKKIVMDCSRYRPDDDRKTQHSKTPNSVRKVMPSRRKSGSPSTQKGKNRSNISMPKRSNILPCPKTQICDENDDPKVAGNSVSTDVLTNSQTGAVCTVTASLDREQTMLEDPQKLTCPVCFMEQMGSSLDGFNTHVDMCLSKGAITEMLQEQRETDKRLSSCVGPSPPAQKRKRMESGGSSGVKTKCIDSFFRR